jgi:type II secretory pathway component PulF
MFSGNDYSCDVFADDINYNQFICSIGSNMLIIITILLLLIYLYLGWKYPAIAMVTCPFVAGVIIFIGVADENIAITASAIVMFIGTLIAILMSERELESSQWPKICAKWILVSFVIFPLMMIAGLLFSHWGSLGVLLVIPLIIFFISRSVTSPHATAAYVISTIGSCMRQNLPLPMALESAASGRVGRHSIILHRIQKWLIQGYSLSESIRRGYPMCPAYAVAMITAAERIDQLPYAIAAIEQDMVAKADERRKIRPVHPLYPVILMLFAFFILLGVMTFVMPSFITALNEMIQPVELSAATRSLIKITRLVSYEYAWLIWFLVVLVVIVIFPYSIYVRFRPRRPDEPFLLSRIGDYIKWHLPILHHFEKNYSLVHVVELLRLSLNAGCPVNEAIENTLDLDLNNCFKKRLRRWLGKVERGENIAAAIRESGLGSPLAWAFDDKVNQGNTLSILETLESFYRSNYSYAVNLARFIMWPCLILCMGVIIGFVVYGIFSPGVVIIKSLAESVIP